MVIKKCGISNVLDGTEDDLLYENTVTSGEESDVGDSEQLNFLNSDSSDEELMGSMQNI